MPLFSVSFYCVFAFLDYYYRDLNFALNYILFFIIHRPHSALLTSDIGSGSCRYYHKLALLSSYQVSLYRSFISVMNTGEVIKSNVIFINFE